MDAFLRAPVPPDIGIMTPMVRLVEFSRRHAIAVVVVGIVLALLAGLVAQSRLGVTTDTDAMFSTHLPWRQQAIAFNNAFPQFRSLVVAVVDGSSPEIADATAAGLAGALAPDTVHFTSVRRPDASPYFARQGLLFLDKPALVSLMERTIDAQPFLGQLAADPSARGLFASLALLGIGVTQDQADLGPYTPALEAFHRSMHEAIEGHPTPMSWIRLLGGDLDQIGGKYRFVLAQPKLDHSALQPGGAAIGAMRNAIAGLEFVKSGQARVRITGSVALADEEFATVAQGMVAGLVFSLVLITLWLFLAVRSWRLILPILGTLGLGLMLTLLFAALAIGTLNLVSIGFGVLFVGIAVDFAIQFCVRYRRSRQDCDDPAQALTATAHRAGRQILIAAATTAAGFLAFVPTDFGGVAELGLIAGVGMVVAFACTLIFLPAALTLCRPRRETVEAGFPWAVPVDRMLVRHRAAVLGGFAGVVVLALIALPRLQFDSDPLHTKDPTTEAMRTLQDLMASPLTNPYSADILAPSVTEAAALAKKLASLPITGDVLTIDSFVPTEQSDKLVIIADAAAILASTLAPREPAASVTAGQIRMAAATALAQIEPALIRLPADQSLAAIAGDLRELIAAPDAMQISVEQALVRFLPDEIDRLRVALTAQASTRADIPEALARDWVLPDGRARVQALAIPGARDSRGLSAFVEAVRGVAPDAGGSAVQIVETAKTIVGAFRNAALFALVAITMILFATLRRVTDVALVLAPLLLAAGMTVLAIVWTGLQLNFANIIALPLLLGVGVSFNVYFVMNWRAGQQEMLSSPTARAVLFSALTTGTAFSTLAASGHPGTASMGLLLLISLACSLTASLVFLPALLACMPRSATSR